MGATGSTFSQSTNLLSSVYFHPVCEEFVNLLITTFADLHLTALADLHLVYTNVATSICNLQLQVNDLRRHHQAQHLAPQALSSSSSATAIVDCSPVCVQGSEDKEHQPIYIDLTRLDLIDLVNCVNNVCHYPSCDFCNFRHQPICDCNHPVIIDLTQADLNNLREYHQALRQTSIQDYLTLKDSAALN